MRDIIDYKNKTIIFFDVEANQYKKNGIINHYLLQISALKIRNNQIIDKINLFCRCNQPINKQVLDLLNKKSWFFKNQKMTDQKAYSEFHKMCKDSDLIVSYGNYDEVVLKDLCKRNNIKYDLEIFDFCLFVEKFFKKNKIQCPSLNSLCNSFDVKIKNEHNALSDTFSLWKVFKKYNKKNLDDGIILKKVAFELLRPKIYKQKLHSSKKYNKPSFENNMYFIFIDLKSKNNYDDEGIRINTIVKLKIEIFNKNKNLVDELKLEKIIIEKDEIVSVLHEIFKEKIFNKIDNSILFYINGSHRWIEKIYLKSNDIGLLTYVIPHTKINDHIKYLNLVFSNELDKYNYLIKNSLLFYNDLNKKFDNKSIDINKE